MIDLNTGVKFLENSRIRHHVVVRCQIHNHTFTLCWLQTTEEGGLATSTSTGGYLEISTRYICLATGILGGQAACRQSPVVVLLSNVRNVMSNVRAIYIFFSISVIKVRPRPMPVTVCQMCWIMLIPDSFAATCPAPPSPSTLAGP